MFMNFIYELHPIIFLAGACGALIADILKDNCLLIPKKLNGVFNLGFFGGLLIGGIAAIFVDGSGETAFLAGFFGREIITRLTKNQAIIIKTIDLKAEVIPK